MRTLLVIIPLIGLLLLAGCGTGSSSSDAIEPIRCDDGRLVPHERLCVRERSDPELSLDTEQLDPPLAPDLMEVQEGDSVVTSSSVAENVFEEYVSSAGLDYEVESVEPKDDGSYRVKYRYYTDGGGTLYATVASDGTVSRELPLP